MMKRIIAATLAAIMLLMPMNAGAVTWGQVVQGLHEGGGSYKADDGTEAEIAGDTLTVTGGELIGDDEGRVWIDMNEFDGVTNYQLLGVTVNGNFFGAGGNGAGNNGASTSLLLDENTKINADEVNFHVDADTEAGTVGNLVVTNQGEIVTTNGAYMHAFDGASVQLNNSGTIRKEGESDPAAQHAFANNGGSATLNNAGAIEGWVNVGVDDQNPGQGGSVSLTNDGTMGDLCVNLENGTADVVNNGTANGDVFVNGTNSETTLVNNGTVAGFFGSTASGEGGKATVTNNGTVEGEFWSEANEGGEMTATNGATGTASWMTSNAHEGSTSNVTNSGKVDAELFVGAQGGEMSVTNNGSIGANFGGFAENGGALTAANGKDGTVTNEFYTDAYGSGSTVNATNDGVLTGYFGVGTEGGNATITNNGTAADMGGDAIAGGNVQVNNEGATNGLYMNVHDGSTGNMENNGDVNGEVWTVATNGSQTGATLNGNASDNVYMITEGAKSSMTLNGGVGGQMVIGGMNGESELVNNTELENGVAIDMAAGFKSNAITIKGNGSLKDSGVKLSVGADSDLSEAEIREIAKKAANSVKVEGGQIGMPNGGTALVTVEVYNQGTLIGEVEVEVEVIKQDDGEDDEPSEEQIRHEMEEKRKAEAIGGVFGSPYWLKQLYLGYMSLNLRLYEDGAQLNFKETISWLKSGETKQIALRVENADVQKLTMRLDEWAIAKLEQAYIAQITLQNAKGEAVMTYSVADLRAAYDQYGLNDRDQLVVGGMDDEVMKIGADGQMVPVEE